MGIYLTCIGKLAYNCNLEPSKYDPSKIYTHFCVLTEPLTIVHYALFHQWGIKKQLQKDEYFCVHPGKDSTNNFC